MFEIIPEQYKENEFYRLGYRVAEKEFTVFTEILANCLQKRFPYLLRNGDCNPLKTQFVLLTFLLDFLLDSHEPQYELAPLLLNRDQNQAYQAVKQQFDQVSSGSQKYQDPYTPLLSELDAARKDRKKIEQEMVLLENEINAKIQIIQERDEDLKKLVIRLQNELDDVNNFGQQIN